MVTHARPTCQAQLPARWGDRAACAKALRQKCLWCPVFRDRVWSCQQGGQAGLQGGACCTGPSEAFRFCYKSGERWWTALSRSLTRPDLRSSPAAGWEKNLKAAGRRGWRGLADVGLHGVEQSGQSDPGGLGSAQESFHTPDGVVCSLLSSLLCSTVGGGAVRTRGRRGPTCGLRGSRHPQAVAG